MPNGRLYHFSRIPHCRPQQKFLCRQANTRRRLRIPHALSATVDVSQRYAHSCMLATAIQLGGPDNVHPPTAFKAIHVSSKQFKAFRKHSNAGQEAYTTIASRCKFVPSPACSCCNPTFTTKVVSDLFFPPHKALNMPQEAPPAVTVHA